VDDPAPSPPERVPQLRLYPDRRYTVLAAIGGIAALGAAAFAGDTAGRLLALVAAIVLAAYVAADLLFTPRVVASRDGVTVNSPLLRRRLTWSDVEDVRADTRSRFGVRSTTLEIDAGATLAVLSRRAIGTEPSAAAELIRAFRPPAGPTR
jgi:hypothetical protein